MRKKITIHVNDIAQIKRRLFVWASKLSPCAFLDSNQYYNDKKSGYLYPDCECIAAVGCLEESQSSFNELKDFYDEKQDWIFAALSYDLKNKLESLSSENLDYVKFPEIHFFQPRIVAYIKEKYLCFEYAESISDEEMQKYIDQIQNIKIDLKDELKDNVAHSRFTKNEYINTVLKIKEDIQKGNIYEMNFCQEFSINNIQLDPNNTFLNLVDQSPSPFSCFYNTNNHYLISASPERFIKKEGNKIISQPIKGTAKRSEENDTDNILKNKLLTDPKERVENIMITDLVRNDLSKTARSGSVEVEELCGVYSFQQAHQMISTVISEKDEDTHIVDVIKEAFPMGSMTGAPKVRAMKLIEKYEKTKRGLYSGTVGYLDPSGNFDFNVIIRSILYNMKEKYVSFSVGSAITSSSDPEREYEECLIKARPMLNVLDVKEINNA